MTIDKHQFRELVDQTLAQLTKDTGKDSLSSADAVELLMMTAAQETLLGTYIKQRHGPALGVFQMEPRTYYDLMKWLERKHPEIYEVVQKYEAPGRTVYEMLKGHLQYQIVLARLYYWRFPAPLPKYDDIEGMATYYKLYWNTRLGAAKVKRVMKNYRRYAL